MTKKANRYKITLEEVELMDQNAAFSLPLTFEFSNHDNLFKIIEMVKGKNQFGEQNQSVEFALGLKLLTEVVMKNRENPLFEEFLPAIKNFMMKLKQDIKKAE